MLTAQARNEMALEARFKQQSWKLVGDTCANTARTGSSVHIVAFYVRLWMTRPDVASRLLIKYIQCDMHIRIARAHGCASGRF